MRTELFNKHYIQQAEKACNDTLKDTYSAILDTAIEQIGKIVLVTQDKERQLQQIKSDVIREVSWLRGQMRTNMPNDLCESAVVAGVDEAIALYKAGKAIV